MSLRQYVLSMVIGFFIFIFNAKQGISCNTNLVGESTLCPLVVQPIYKLLTCGLKTDTLPTCGLFPFASVTHFSLYVKKLKKFISKTEPRDCELKNPPPLSDQNCRFLRGGPIIGSHGSREALPATANECCGSCSNSKPRYVCQKKCGSCSNLCHHCCS